MIQAGVRRFDAWVENAYSAKRVDLSCYRILYAGYMLCAVVPIAPWLKVTPFAFFSPPLGLASTMVGFPPNAVLVTCNVALVVVLSMLLVGACTRLASVCTGVLLVILNSWFYSIGKVNHDILLVFIPLIIAGAGWGDELSLRACRRGRSLEQAVLNPQCKSRRLAFLAFLVSILMFSAGLPKLATGWLNPSTKATFGHMVSNMFITGRETWLSSHLLKFKSPLLWESGDWAAVGLEMTFGVAFLSQRFMRVMMALACVFHLGVWFMFDIVFAPNVVAYGAFVSYSGALTRLSAVLRPIACTITPRLTSAFNARLVTAIGCLAALAGFAAIYAEVPIAESIGLSIPKVVVLCGAIVGAGYLMTESANGIRLLVSWLRSPPALSESAAMTKSVDMGA